MPDTVKAIAVPLTGPLQELDLPATDGLKELQALVGGYIEATPVPEFVADADDATAYINEEGLILELPANTRAIDFFGGGLVAYIAGPLVLVGFDPRSGTHRNVPAGVRARIELIAQEAGL